LFDEIIILSRRLWTMRLHSSRSSFPPARLGALVIDSADWITTISSVLLTYRGW
jgi:hypothetical protein